MARQAVTESGPALLTHGGGVAGLTLAAMGSDKKEVYSVGGEILR